MKKNSGFTLIEILGVVVIIAAISLLAFPPILEQIRKTHSSISDTTLELIYAGADLYADNELTGAYRSVGSTYCVPLRFIVDKGFLNEPITDTMTNKDLDLDTNVVRVSYDYNAGDFSYTLVSDGSCVEQRTILSFEEVMEKSDQVLANDPDENLRYVGSDPNNYVRFNGELWRIIGLFEGQPKLIRNSPIRNMPWDENENFEWNQSALYNHLNTTYFDSMNSVSKGYIDQDYSWNSSPAISFLPSFDRVTIYDQERNGFSFGSESVVIHVNAPVGLMNFSDYLYSNDETSNKCNEVLNFNFITGETSSLNEECVSTMWLYTSGKSLWTMTVGITLMGGSGGFIFTIEDNYFNSVSPSSSNIYVRPVVFLKPNVGIRTGTGTKTDPYILQFIDKEIVEDEEIE